MNKSGYGLVVNTSIDEGVLSIREFVWPVQRALPFPSKVVSLSRLKKSDVKNSSFIIFSGCPLENNLYQSYFSKLDWLKNVDVPMLGICSGQHLLGAVFGGKIRKMEKPVIGMYPVRKTKNHFLLDCFSQSFKVYGLRQFDLVPGKNFDSIASSSFSDSEVIVHKNKKIAGVSFHPEVCNRSFFYSFFEWAGH